MGLLPSCEDIEERISDGCPPSHDHVISFWALVAILHLLVCSTPQSGDIDFLAIFGRNWHLTSDFRQKCPLAKMGSFNNCHVSLTTTVFA